MSKIISSLPPPTNNIFSRDVKDRFWKFINSRKAGECWNWDGSLAKNGYGNFNYKSSTHYSHRISWIMHYGYISNRLLVLHKCDNKRCINPLHLYLGTHLDNMKDRVERSPESFRAINYSKLTRQDAYDMSELYQNGNTYSTIGTIYNVDPKTVGNILNNKTTHFAEDRR